MLSGGNGKIREESAMAAVIAEMVRQYSPDRDKAVTWSNGSGGNYGVTLLGAHKPATNSSHDSIAVVRTLVADTDADGKVLGGRLVEFISPDPLDPSLFQDYAKQWLTCDFDDTKMLAAEYTIGYVITQANLYSPGDSVAVRPETVSLKNVGGPGKVESDLYCYVRDVRYGDICWGLDDDLRCITVNTDIYITCVEMGDEEDEDDGCPPEGCDPAGDSSDSQDLLSLSCPTEVTRGGSGSCSVTTDSAGFDLTALSYSWSSSLGATASGTGMTSWRGIATETATVTVVVDGYDPIAPQSVSVVARDAGIGDEKWGTKEMAAAPEPSSEPQKDNRHGLYKVLGYFGPGVDEGGGPWAGRFMVTKPPEIASKLLYDRNYASNGPAHPNADETCDAANSLDEANYHVMNDTCGRGDQMATFLRHIIRHERGHESSFNRYLRNGGPSTMRAIEAMTDADSSKLYDDALVQWKSFYEIFKTKGGSAPGVSGCRWFYWHDGSKWVESCPGITYE